MRGAIFDLDDTLYPYERFLRSGFAAVAQRVERRYRVPASRVFLTLTTTAAVRGGGELDAVCDHFGLRRDAVPELLDVLRAHDPELWPYHDADAALRRLRSSGWRIAILTNGLPNVQAAKVRALGLDARVDHVVYAAEYAPGGKPHRAAFDEASRRLGCAPRQCVMVGDHPVNDVHGAREAGMRTIRIRRRGPDVTCGADRVVDSLAEVPLAAASLVGIGVGHAA